MSTVEGYCDTRFEKMRDVLTASLDSGEDLGASVAVVADGAMAVDLWGGWADTALTLPWTEHTLTNVWLALVLEDVDLRLFADTALLHLCL